MSTSCVAAGSHVQQKESVMVWSGKGGVQVEAERDVDQPGKEDSGKMLSGDFRFYSNMETWQHTWVQLHT